VLHRRSFFQGRSIRGLDVADIEWYRPDGGQMDDDEWSNGLVRCIGLLLNGQIMDERDLRGRPETDDVLMVLLNAYHETIPFTLPGVPDGLAWEVELDTARIDEKSFAPTPPGESYEVQGRSIVVLCQPVKSNAPEVDAVSETLESEGIPANFLPLAEGEHTIVGNVMTIASLGSTQLGIVRDIKVYLPPSHGEGTKHYPVIYMHDGQNLFDQATAYIDEWRVDETMEALAREGIEAIVVGIPNAGRGRLDEYGPFVDPEYGGGRGDDYLTFIVHTLKPYIDSSFRTLPEREQTGMFGSSMGGLISLYAYFQYPETFGFVGAMSPSLWFARRAIFPYVEGAEPRDGRIYLDIGTAEGEDTVEDTRRMAELLQERGCGPEDCLRYVEAQGAGHSESAWSARLRDALVFLLPERGEGE
jgi:glycogen operon protein